MAVGGRQVASGDEFRSLGTAYHQKAQELRSLANYLQSQVSGAMWQGNAATKFRTEWATHKRNMQQLEHLLDQLSTELKTKRAPLADQLNTR
jgi:WXG100 family type VII secretion target